MFWVKQTDLPRWIVKDFTVGYCLRSLGFLVNQVKHGHFNSAHHESTTSHSATSQIDPLGVVERYNIARSKTLHGPTGIEIFHFPKNLLALPSTGH